ncbi:unnamed protein product, partial [Lymnaea stagnalis]
MISRLSLLVISLLSLVASSRTQVVYFNVTEEQPAPAWVGNIASGANIHGGPGTTFTLLYHTELFTINSTTGDLRTRVVLDRETVCDKSVDFCSVNPSVIVASPQAPYRKVSVVVNVVDVNDQIPAFQAPNPPLIFSESSPVNKTVKLNSAFDLDGPENRVRDYYLQGEGLNVFDLVVQKVNMSGGSYDFTLFLRLISALDREVTNAYYLNLVATDGDHTVKLPLDITVEDANDNTPRFIRATYEQTVNETSPPGTLVLRVSATDPDEGENGRVVYEFPLNVDARILETFEMNSDTGDITLRRSLVSEGGSNYTFKVKAHDNGANQPWSMTDVVVTVRDTVNDPPSITISRVKFDSEKDATAAVAEDSPVGTLIAYVIVIDSDLGDDGVTRCSTSHDHFSLLKVSPKEYTISLDRPLDREIVTSYEISVVCTDNGNPPLSSVSVLAVRVEDVNDNPPVFSRQVYQMRVKENQPAVALVGSVYATDADVGPNARLRYALPPDVDYFRIDDSNGAITTAIRNLDREQTSRYSFEVYAFDESLSPLSATTTVIVEIEDMNDNWPTFQNASYKFIVSENALVRSVVGSVHATDPDSGLGGSVEYLLVLSPLQPEAPFSISVSEGTITLTQPLDFENTRRYSFVASAFDQGKPPRNSSVEIQVDVIDENDNPPIIDFPGSDNQSVTLNLDVSPGHEVVKVIAHDADSGENGRLSYSLSAPNTSVPRLFWINEDTGLVTLISPLSSADVQTYNIVISVHDNGVDQKATQALLRVDVVDQKSRPRLKESYTTIVIIMVCVTLFVAVVVLATLCFIKHLDKRKFTADKHAHKHTFDQPSKETAVYITEGGGDEFLEKALVPHPSHDTHAAPFQQQRLGSQTKFGKKCVTFDSAVRESDTSMTSDSWTLPPLYFNLSDSTTNTFSAGTVDTKALGDVDPGDQVVDVALQKHNALVRSMRLNKRP